MVGYGWEKAMNIKIIKACNLEPHIKWALEAG